MKKEKQMELLKKRLDELNNTIRGLNSDVMKMINVSAETELIIRNKNTPSTKIKTVENRIEEILKKYS
jgi:tetrahydromethanopterin S-methyltransferase subunit G